MENMPFLAYLRGQSFYYPVVQYYSQARISKWPTEADSRSVPEGVRRFNSCFSHSFSGRGVATPSFQPGRTRHRDTPSCQGTPTHPHAMRGVGTPPRFVFRVYPYIASSSEGGEELSPLPVQKKGGVATPQLQNVTGENICKNVTKKIQTRSHFSGFSPSDPPFQVRKKHLNFLWNLRSNYA